MLRALSFLAVWGKRETGIANRKDLRQRWLRTKEDQSCLDCGEADRDERTIPALEMAGLR